jgi:hypothetical protein
MDDVESMLENRSLWRTRSSQKLSEKAHEKKGEKVRENTQPVLNIQIKTPTQTIKIPNPKINYKFPN